MAGYLPIKIDTEEVFEIFPNAPIVESVIDIRARAVNQLDETTVRAHLEGLLKDYRYLDSQRIIRHEVKVEPGKPPSQDIQDFGWRGMRFISIDEKHIAQFNRDGFAFSRFAPYVDWLQFSEEGLKLWHNFNDMARPDQINRIGLRFINRIQLPRGEMNFENYMQHPPAAPNGLELPFMDYMHKDTLAVPGQGYAINVIQTIQPPKPDVCDSVALILDIDVFTTRGFQLSEVDLNHKLAEMRWLKDKAFFGSITEKAKELFR